LSDELKTVVDERLKTLNNLCLAHFKLESFDSALEAAQTVLAAQVIDTSLLT